ncbi:MAG: ORF6N domain-containing protein [bacterium]|nr:ORF6N domain-containing protein [bacterium]
MKRKELIPVVSIRMIERKILLIRGEKVLIDSDLAELYGVTTRVFNQAVKRNFDRFPHDFMFQLNKQEASALRSQIVTLETGRGKHRKYFPYVFTEQGVAMLSSVLNSKRAIAVNIEIMRTFVKLRELIATHADLSRKLNELEQKYDYKFKVVFDAIKALMNPPKPKYVKPKRIGFNTK